MMHQHINSKAEPNRLSQIIRWRTPCQTSTTNSHHPATESNPTQNHQENPIGRPQVTLASGSLMLIKRSTLGIWVRASHRRLGILWCTQLSREALSLRRSMISIRRIQRIICIQFRAVTYRVDPASLVASKRLIALWNKPNNGSRIQRPQPKTKPKNLASNSSSPNLKAMLTRESTQAWPKVRKIIKWII